MTMHTLNVMSRRNRNPFIFYSLKERSQDVAICLFFWFTNHTSHLLITDPFTRHLAQFHINFYVLCNYCHTHKDGGVLEYPPQDYVHDIPSRKYKKIFLEKFPAQSLSLFMYTGSIKLQIWNHYCALNRL